MLLSWSRNTCAKSLHILILSVLGIAFTRAMASIIITLYFDEVSFIRVRPSLVTSGACVLSADSISWPFSLLEAILADVFMAGVCMASCSLLTKSSRWWSILALSKAKKTVPPDANKDRGTTPKS